MCVPSYSVCLKGPQEKCVCCWHSPFNIVWIFFFQDPSPVTRALCFQTCLYIPCVCVCVCVYVCVCVCVRTHVCVCLQRHYRHYLAWNVTYLVNLYPSVHILLYIYCFGVFSNLEIWESPAGDSSSPGPVIQLQTATLFQRLLCKGPWHSLECRSVQVTDKARVKRGGLLCVPERIARD